MFRLDANARWPVERKGAALGCEAAADHRIIIISTAMIATMTAAITAMCMGLESMCRTMAKRVPSGRRAMPQTVQTPGVCCRTLRCIGQM